MQQGLVWQVSLVLSPLQRGMPSLAGYLDIVITVHDTGEVTGPKVLNHVLQGLPFGMPSSHHTVLCSWDTHGNRLAIIQLVLQQSERASGTSYSSYATRITIHRMHSTFLA